MVNESFLTLACAGVIGTVFGLLLAFFGYRLFLVLLPIWGFFFGLFLGADTMHYLFGYGFLATITSWVVGFVVGGIFAVLSYFFYMAAVAVVAGSLGYFVVIAIWLALGLSTGFLAWLIAIIVAAAFIIVTFAFNLQKWVIMIATASPSGPLQPSVLSSCSSIPLLSSLRIQSSSSYRKVGLQC